MRVRINKTWIFQILFVILRVNFFIELEFKYKNKEKQKFSIQNQKWKKNLGNIFIQLEFKTILVYLKVNVLSACVCDGIRNGGVVT